MIIGLDVGGTYTDVVLLGREGLAKSVKVLTDPCDLFCSVLEGLERITEGIDPRQIDRIVLSTTLTTNAIVQKKIPPVAMIVAGGPGIEPELFRTNRSYFTVGGCIDHRGREIKPVDPAEIREIAGFCGKEGIRIAGVVGKFSVRNPCHELLVQEILGESFEKIFLGHRISGNLNFPRRIATTFLNAAVYPVHQCFFEAVKRSLEKKGLSVPIHILKADGGTMSFEASLDFPGQSILSGPAASVVGALCAAPENEDCLVLDIGGTTTDMAVLIDRVPVLAPLGIELGGYKSLIRSIETHSIGIGGDSLVRVEDGRLEIGPERCGPAMAYGGGCPTPTDALFVLGAIETGDRARSRDGIAGIGARLGVPADRAAFSIFDRCCKEILREARNMIDRINSKPVYTVRELQEGYRVKPKRILVLGGPAPYFAGHLEALSGLKTIVVPRWEVANAIGAAIARTTCEVTLFADTELGIAAAPEENFSRIVDRGFTREDAVRTARDLLRQKAMQRGADAGDLEMEVVEELQFNMVRGFYTTGKNIRVKVQVKPGLIQGGEAIVKGL